MKNNTDKTTSKASAGAESAQGNCPVCKGTGLDKAHTWPDGSFAACETCDGYGSTKADQIIGCNINGRLQWIKSLLHNKRTNDALYEIDALLAFFMPDSDCNDLLDTMVRESTLKSILNHIGQSVRNMAEENGYDADMSLLEDDARIVFHAAAHVKS